MRLAVLMPSRGKLVGRMRESVDEACRGLIYQPFYTHTESIPDCFNLLSQRAYDWGADLFWFVEEDVCIPKDAFQLLLDLDADIAAINYGTHLIHSVQNKPWISAMRSLDTGELLWVSLGCTMVRRCVFEAMPKPWFRVDQDISARLKNWTEWKYELIPREWDYGGQDSTFCFRATQLGFTLKDHATVVCEHLPKPREEAA
jgi:hypothetical protein